FMVERIKFASFLAENAVGSQGKTESRATARTEPVFRAARRIDPSAVLPHSLVMANTFGQLFRVTTWGESHGGGVGVVVDGCPPKLELSEADIQPDLDRRRPGQSKIVSPRRELDRVRLLSGTFGGQTLGTPISMWVENK